MERRKCTLTLLYVSDENVHPLYCLASVVLLFSACMPEDIYHKVYCYLDDFILVGKSFEKCQEAQIVLIELMGELGLYTNWKKCTSSDTKCKYLGVEIDSNSMELLLPYEKLQKLHDELKFFESRKRVTKRQLQPLLGILAHCGRVIRWARTF